MKLISKSETTSIRELKGCGLMVMVGIEGAIMIGRGEKAMGAHSKREREMGAPQITTLDTHSNGVIDVVYIYWVGVVIWCTKVYIL
ncbi:hypothetical protein RchiOBHm_Chr6g0270321 [Rosa chinensis]|uniref:Uncharacterized protein n=1 Tax=Rosa chinensis TaxID=74649 RepID=A0A2P6PQR7_ROSCH|nr:hypothetical protein RchiOBHm_Chr6g0270321 [Rosa chinensis]